MAAPFVTDRSSAATSVHQGVDDPMDAKKGRANPSLLLGQVIDLLRSSD